MPATGRPRRSCAAWPTAGAAQPDGTNDTCLTCHADKDADGRRSQRRDALAATSTRETFAKSVHGEKLSCADCHPEMTEVPHPERTVQARARVQRRLLRAVQALSLRQLREDARRRARAPRSQRGDAPRRSASTATARTTSRAPSEPRAPHLADLREVPRGRRRRLREERARRGARSTRTTPTCRCAPTATARTTSPTHAPGVAASRRPRCAARCHADEQLMEKYGLSTDGPADLPGRLPRHDRVACARRGGDRGARASIALLHRLPRRPRHREGRRPGLAGAARPTS